jgi:hypothetical protein
LHIAEWNFARRAPAQHLAFRNYLAAADDDAL